MSYSRCKFFLVILITKMRFIGSNVKEFLIISCLPKEFALKYLSFCASYKWIC